MLRIFRFLLYCLAVFIGVAGLLEGGVPLLKYAIERMKGNYFDAYALLSSYDRFSSEVILILSFMLLIVVHIGHVLAGGLRFTKTEKPVSLQAQPVSSLQPPQKEISNPLSQSGQAQAPAGIDNADEKLASLVKKPKDNQATWPPL